MGTLGGMAAMKRPARKRFPAGNRRRAGTVKFSFAPTPPFRLGLAAWTLRRRGENAVDRWDGTTYRRVLPLDGVPVEVAVTQVASGESPRLRVAVTGRGAGSAAKAAIAPILERMLGLRADLSDFYRFANRNARLAALAERFRGMKPPRFPTVFEALINGIACQQMSLTLGIQLLNRLADAYGLAWSDGETPAHAFPRPEDLAGLRPQALRPLGFSHQKSRAMIEASRAVCQGQLDLESLVEVRDEEAVERLQQLRGVWPLDRGVRSAPRPGAMAHFSRRRCGRTRRPDALAQVESTTGLPASPPCADAMERLRRADLFPSAARWTFDIASPAMKKNTTKQSALILTVGHSTRTLETLIHLLQSHQVTLVVDVRTIPRSRHNPQFNRETLPDSLRAAGIDYEQSPGLGGFGTRKADSPNMAWRNASFRGYADYMQTDEFEERLNALMDRSRRTAWP